MANHFYGGTYFPPTPRHGLPSFREVLISVAEAWASNKTQIQHSAKTLTEHIQQNQSWTASVGTLLENEKLQDAADILINNVDQQNGGWGSAPKFPAPMILDFLLLIHAHNNNGGIENQNALNAATYTLHQMQKGGIYDVVGGGFHRYATDHAWLIPHFEKMLYDNAQLAGTYLHAYLDYGRTILSAEHVKKPLIFSSGKCAILKAASSAAWTRIQKVRKENSISGHQKKFIPLYQNIPLLKTSYSPLTLSPHPEILKGKPFCAEH